MRRLKLLALSLCFFCILADSVVQAQTPPPIPALDTWEWHMQVEGAHNGNPAVIASTGLYDGAAWYYDGAKIMYQIADYTGNIGWNESAKALVRLYRDWVLSIDGRVPGYKVFPHGLALDFQRTRDPLSKQAVLLLSTNAAYANTGGGADESLSRETAYLLSTYLLAEQLGAPRSPHLEEAKAYALGHIQQWFVAKSSPNWAPFMFGLTAEALIQYYLTVQPDPNILSAILLGADATWDLAWSPTACAFFYRADDPNGWAPDLNNLLTPVFAWLYSKTGEPRFQERGDAAFACGLNNAYLGKGKIFSQNYRWTFDFVKWRTGDRTPPKASDPALTIQGGQAGIAWTTNEPSLSQVEYGVVGETTTHKTTSKVTRTKHYLTIRPLTGGKTYRYRTISTDPMGNLRTSDWLTFAATAKDVQAPRLLSVRVEAPVYWNLSWVVEVDEESKVEVQWGPTSAYEYGWTIPEVIPWRRLHVISMHGEAFPQAHWPLPGTQPHYQIRVTDRAGNVTLSEDKSWVSQ